LASSPSEPPHKVRICLLAPDMTKSNISRPLAFARLLSRRCQVHVLGPGDPNRPLYATASGVRMTKMEEGFPGKVFRAWIHARNADVVVACDARLYSSVVGFISKLRGRRFVFDTGDDEVALARLEGGRVRSLLPRLSFVSRFFADQVTVASSILRSKYGGIVCPVPVDGKFFSSGSAEVANEEFGLPPGRKVVAYVGTVKVGKGIDTLLESFRILHRRVPDSHLLVVGEIDKGIRPVASRLRADPHITFTGHIEFDKVPDVFARADVLVLPNPDNPIHRAQCPIKLIEYMASGKPIVATAVGDVPHILGGTGFIVPPDNPRQMAAAIEQALQAGQLLTRRRGHFDGFMEVVRRKVETLFLGEAYPAGERIPRDTFVSVVIPARNEEKRIGACIDSLRNQTRRPDEIIVVDSGSEDRTGEIARLKGARVIRIEPRPPGATRNAGWRRARGEVILFADGDTILSRFWVERMLVHLRRNRAVADVRSVLRPKSFFLKVLQANYKMNYYNYEPFCAWAYTREMLERTGGFDETLPVSEERELGERLRSIGYDIVFEPQAVQFHTGGPRTLTDAFKRNIRYGRERVKYRKRTGRKNTRFWFVCSLGLLGVVLLLWNIYYLFLGLAILYVSLFLRHAFWRGGIKVTKLRYVAGAAVLSFIDNIASAIGTAWGLVRYKSWSGVEPPAEARYT